MYVKNKTRSVSKENTLKLRVSVYNVVNCILDSKFDDKRIHKMQTDTLIFIVLSSIILFC